MATMFEKTKGAKEYKTLVQSNQKGTSYSYILNQNCKLDRHFLDLPRNHSSEFNAPTHHHHHYCPMYSFVFTNIGSSSNPSTLTAPTELSFRLPDKIVRADKYPLRHIGLDLTGALQGNEV